MSGIEVPVLNFLLGRLKEIWHSREPIRLNHHSELKKHVLSPLQYSFRTFYLPVCELKCGVICRGPRTIHRVQESVTDSPIDRVEFRLWIRSPEPEYQDFPARKESPSPELMRALEEDARQNHWKDLFKLWHEFSGVFRIHADRCLGVVESLKSELVREIRLAPLMQSVVPARPWASYEQLAIYIFERRMGIIRNELQITNYGNKDPKGLRVSGFDADLIQPTSIEEARGVLEKVEKLVLARGFETDILSGFEALAPRAVGVQAAIQTAMTKGTLSGSCSFTH